MRLGFLVVRLKVHVQSHLCAVKPKTQCDCLTSDYTYELELERRCMFNWSFLPMDSTNSNVLFRFDVLLHPRPVSYTHLTLPTIYSV